MKHIDTFTSADAGVVTLKTSNYEPCTFSLASTSATRKIEVSFNNGVKWSVPPYDIEETDLLVVMATYKVDMVRFTAVEGDTWGVL